MWLPLSHLINDGKPFLAWQEGEIYVGSFTDERIPRLVFRQHRNRVDRHYRYVDIEFEGKIVKASVPVDQPWKEQMEHVWRTETRGFTFNPQYFARYEEPR